MKMRGKRIAVAALATVLLCALILGGCGGGGGDALKGTWEGESEDFAVTWTFDGKGGCKMENEFGFKDDGTYTVDGSSAQIKLSQWDDEIGYQFKVDGNKLILTADESYRPSYDLEKK